MSIYGSSKAAVIGFTKSWAKELAPHGIRVNCVSPSLIEATGMQGEMPDCARDSVSRIPMGRAARADEVANSHRFPAVRRRKLRHRRLLRRERGRASY